MYEDRVGAAFEGAGQTVGRGLDSANAGLESAGAAIGNAYYDNVQVPVEKAGAAYDNAVNTAGEKLGNAYYDASQAAQGAKTAGTEMASRAASVLGNVKDNLLTIDAPQALAMAQQLKSERQRIIEVANRFSTTVNQLLAAGLQSQANSAAIAGMGVQMKTGANNMGEKLNRFSDELVKEANDVMRNEGVGKSIGEGIDFKF